MLPRNVWVTHLTSHDKADVNYYTMQQWFSNWGGRTNWRILSGWLGVSSNFCYILLDVLSTMKELGWQFWLTEVFCWSQTFYIHQIFKNLLEKDSKWLQPNCDQITELWYGCRWSCCFGKGDICNFRIQWQSSYLVIEASDFPRDWLETKNNSSLH